MRQRSTTPNRGRDVYRTACPQLLSMFFDSRQLLIVAACSCLACGGERPPLAPTLPALEFSLGGLVRDTAFRRLADVKVEVIEGPRAGVSATTNALGRYELPGVFSDAIIVHASKDGYVSIRKSYRTTYSGRQDLSFDMEPSTPSVNIAGNYTMTLSADTTCSGLPSALRTRTYAAVIVPVSSQGSPPNLYQSTLTGAAFAPSIFENHFSIGVAGSFASFDTDFDGIGIAEKLGDSVYLAFLGQADLAAMGSELAGPFRGWLEYCDGYDAGGRYYRCAVNPVICSSDNHRVTLVRR